jgi:hypothetical protein
MNFWKFMVHEFLKFMVHQLFRIQCPKDFWDFAVFYRLAQAGGGGPYYMIFHYQKVSVISLYSTLATCLKPSHPSIYKLTINLSNCENKIKCTQYSIQKYFATGGE